MKRRSKIFWCRLRNLKLRIKQKGLPYRLLVPLLILLLLEWFIPWRTLNPLGISSTESASGIFNIIAGGLVSLFGIFVAVFLVTLELLRRNYG